MLGEEGHRVLEADCRSEALKVLNQARGRVDLLVLDVVMPEGGGVELAREVREQWPDQRIMYMSAYPDEVLSAQGLPSADAPFLAKPYTRNELVAKVREATER
jgi:DNA-binding response OmpR family regulator